MAENEQALAVIELLYRLTRSLTEDVRSHVTEVADLDPGEFVLLRAIAGGTTSPGELSRAVSSHPAATSRILTRLSRAGLIQRRPDPDDSRRTEITLTAQGRTVTRRIAARIRPRLQQRLDRLGAGEAARFVDTLRLLLPAEHAADRP
ncbi:hypothetical protein Athai_13310 [Actinocatenispora thailandica]|uniref:HTH marR-type domain-containing protein n=1 Tax=Actinocatenispora thailandica TaxID=227318 RepID=A0A7R7HVJ2_9ACTN|nr:MarR family transcriptional regulator [Actinocatenispora thailandica]BCJ33828.1 hypothetical protein Athai_13310 [Actinocatenispora thailandica]